MRKQAFLRAGIAAGMLGLGISAVAQGNPQAKTATPGARKPSSPSASTAAPDKVVMKVGNQSVTESEFESVVASLGPNAEKAVAQDGPKRFGDSYATLLALAQRAEGDHLDASPEVQQALALQRLKTLAQAEYAKMTQQVTVMPAEVNQYYTDHKPEFEQAEIRRFIVAKKAPNAPANAPGITEAEAKAKIDAIRRAIGPGSDIAAIGRKFSIPGTVIIDSDTQTVGKGQWLPQLDQAIFAAKDGELTPTIETPQALVFLQVVSHHQRDLKEVSRQIENTLRQQKLDEAVANLKKNASIWMDENFFGSAKPQSPTPAAPKPLPSQKP